MKNSYLFITIIFLIGFIYIFEETKTRDEYQEEQKREELFSQKEMGTLRELSGANFNIRSENDKFISPSGIEVSKNQISFFLEQLQNIKIQRILSEKEVSFIETSTLKEKIHFLFTSGELEIQIGEKLQFNSSFYLKVSNLKQGSSKWAVAKYENGYTESLSTSTNGDAYRSSGPYDQVRSIFSLSDDFFYNLNPFTGTFEGEMTIDSFRNPKFVVNFVELKTIPEAFKGVSYQKDNFEKIIETIKKFKAKKVILKKFELNDKIGEIKLGEALLTLYRKYGGENGYFLEKENQVYFLNAEIFRSVFVPLQYFWNRKLNVTNDESFTVYNDAGAELFKGRLSVASKWSDLLNKEAHVVREQIANDFLYTYKLAFKSQSFLVREGRDGVEILDEKLHLIYQFLDKIQ